MQTVNTSEMKLNLEIWGSSFDKFIINLSLHMCLTYWKFLFNLKIPWCSLIIGTKENNMVQISTTVNLICIKLIIAAYY